MIVIALRRLRQNVVEVAMLASETDPEKVRSTVEALRRSLDARATGLWRVEEDRLKLLAFAPAPDMPGEVAQGFIEAAGVVGLDQIGLGVVNAVVNRSIAVSLAGRLPVETGSGYWLRAFEAARSVAVPLERPDGSIAAVLSAALPTLGPPEDQDAAALIRQFGVFRS